jgi:heat shock protein HslJ
MKTLKVILLIVVLALVAVLVSGMFNTKVQPEDIFIEQEDGTLVQAQDVENAEVLSFTIAPTTVACEEGSDEQCLVVNGEIFTGNIENFEFQEGEEQEITVVRNEVLEPQEGEERFRYRRVVVRKSDEVTEEEVIEEDTEEQELVEETPEPIVLVPAELTSQDWFWQQTTTGGETTEANDSSAFQANFTIDGKFSTTTDCNNAFGGVTVSGNTLVFGPLATTLMACADDSQEGEYLSSLSTITGYSIENGQLVLARADGGDMIFTSSPDAELIAEEVEAEPEMEEETSEEESEEETTEEETQEVVEE